MSLGALYPQAGLVGLWHLDGNSNDASGSGNNGADTNITYNQANGKIGLGAGFGGSSGIVIAGDTNMNIGTGAFTVTIKLKTTVNGSFQVFFANDTNGASTPRRIFRLDMETDNKCSFTLYDNGAAIGNRTTKVVNDGKWHTIVLSRNGDSVYLILDGCLQQITTGAAALNYGASNSFTYFGRKDDASGYLNGQEDENALFNVYKDPSWARRQYSILRFGEL